MVKNLEKTINEIANENKQSKATSANVDMSANEVKAQKELTDREKVDAFLTNNAISHYCAATGKSIGEITAKLESISTSEKGTYYLFTAPTFDEKTTQESWEKENSSCIRVEKFYKNQWYKRALTVGSAIGVCRLINALERYEEDKEKSEDRKEKKFEEVAKLLGVSVDALKALQK